MAKVTIRGKEFPLCMTVTALDKINDKCGGLDKLTEFVLGGGDLCKAFYNTAWMLALLIEEGEKNRQVCDCFDGRSTDAVQLPDYDQLCSMVTIHTMMQLRNVCLDAVKESMEQDIEASYSKNAENAELE